MKAIYTTLNNEVYRINQNTALPTTLVHSAPGARSTMNIDTANRAISQSVHINTIENPGVKSNKELFVELADYLKTNQITEIKVLQDFFKVYIDYSMYEDGREIEHSAVIQPLRTIDQMYPLGVATNNECVYRRVKTFSTNVAFTVRNQLPHGIMQVKKKSYQLKINNIAIFQDSTPHPEVHNSTYAVPYFIGAATIQTSLDSSVMVYSTDSAGIDIQEIDVDFIPRMVTVNMNVTLSNYIVAYTEDDVNNILIQNIEDKYHTPDTDDPEVPDDGDDPGILIPVPDDKPDADGDDNPDDDGYFDFYERCKSRTPHGLLVVEDMIPDGSYNIVTMIKKQKVIDDIPDITVGEYVVYRESLVSV